MIIRDLTINDLVLLEKHALFPLTNIRCQPKVLEFSMEDERGLLGSVIINKTVEIAMVLAPRPIRDKVVALRAIEDMIYTKLIPLGYRDAHAFVTDPQQAKILVDHFGFNYTQGQALVRRA